MSDRFFDGLEGAPARTELACPACGAAVPLDAWSFVARARTGDAIGADAAAAFGLLRHGKPPFVATVEPRERLYAYVGDLACPGCGAACEVAIGLAEIQPCRYAAITAGIRVRPVQPRSGRG